MLILKVTLRCRCNSWCLVLFDVTTFLPIDVLLVFAQLLSLGEVVELGLAVAIMLEAFISLMFLCLYNDSRTFSITDVVASRIIAAFSLADKLGLWSILYNGILNEFHTRVVFEDGLIEQFVRQSICYNAIFHNEQSI